MSKLSRIEAFLKVVEENSFAKAARKMHLTTAAVSKQVGLLEGELGVQLLHRSTRSLSLTENGRLYLERAKRILEEVQAADALMATAQAEPQGHLRVMSTRYLGERYIVSHLASFLERYPHITLDLEIAERFPEGREDFDIVFGVTLLTSPDSIARKIITTRYVMCASPHYLERFGIPQKPLDLVHHRYIAHKMRRPNNLIRFKDGKEVTVEPALYLNDTFAMLQCAIDGVGLTRVHDYAAAEALSKGKLVEVLEKYAEPAVPVYLTYEHGLFPQPKITAFIDFVTENLAR